MQPVTFSCLLAALAGPIALAYVGERVQPRPPKLALFLAAQVCLCALAASVLAIAMGVEGRPPQSLGLANPGVRSAALGLILAGFFIYVYGPVAYWALSRLRVTGFERGMSRLEGLPTWSLVVAVVVGGAAEEILYRAYAFERLAEFTGSVWLAAALPLLFFAIAHAPLWGWPAALTMLVSGGILTAWYAWHRDLAANIIAHCVTDLFGIVIAPWLHKRRANSAAHSTPQT